MKPKVSLGVIVLLVAVGLIAGGVIGGVAGTPDNPALVKSPPPKPGADFPDGARSFLPKVTASSIRNWMKGNAYECEPDKKPEDAQHQETCWAPDDASATAYVTLEYDRDDQVRSAFAKCELGPRSPADYCQRLFRFLVETTYARQPAFQKQAVAWTGKNLGNDAVSLIGGMELSMELQDHRLQLYPEG